MISNKRKKSLQHDKELKSFRNKMGIHLVWFDSLSKKKKYDLLFLWKNAKKINTLKSPIISKEKRFDYSIRNFKFIEVKKYPLKFKHWIIIQKNSYQFRTQNKYVRNSAIDLILNKK